MATFEEAQALIDANIYSGGTPGHITASVLKIVLDAMLEAANDELVAQQATLSTLLQVNERPAEPYAGLQYVDPLTGEIDTYISPDGTSAAGVWWQVR